MTRVPPFAKIAILQMDFGGMKVADDGHKIGLEDPMLVECLNVAGDAQREGDFTRADEILRQVITDYSPTDLPIDVLCPLTIRVLNVLHNYSIVTVADLVQRRLSNLRDWYNFGKASRSHLGERLRAFGLNLVDQHDHEWIRPPKNLKPRLDRLLILPTFYADQGYRQEHVIQALSAIAADAGEDFAAIGASTSRRLSLAPGSRYGIDMFCNRTDLAPMTLLRLVRDLVAKKLVDEPTPGAFSLSLSGLRLVQESERQAAAGVEASSGDAGRSG